MKRYLMIALVLISFLVLYGCSNNESTINKDTKNIETKSPGVRDNSKNSTMENNTQKSGEQVQKQDISKIITDLDSWKHPVKEIFKQFSVKVKEAELSKNETYPTFYVSINKSWLKGNRDIYLTNLIKQIAYFNGYWSYSIQDDEIKIDVQCNNQKIDKVNLNGSDYILSKNSDDYSIFSGEYIDEKYIYTGKVSSTLQVEYDKEQNMINASLKTDNNNPVLVKALLDIAMYKGMNSGFFFTNDKSYNENRVGLLNLELEDLTITFSGANRTVYFKKDFIEKVKKAYDIVSKKYNAYRENTGTVKQDDYSDFTSYAVYEGIDDNKNIIIAVRRARDTVIQTWIHVNPQTWEYTSEY